jgi:hypothetical protein
MWLQAVDFTLASGNGNTPWIPITNSLVKQAA